MGIQIENMASNLDAKGCEFGRFNRARIDRLEETQSQIMKSLKDIQNSNTEMFNHFTERYEKMFKELEDRMPKWVVIVGALGGTLIGGLLIWAVTH